MSYPRTAQGTQCTGGERPSAFFPGAYLTVSQCIVHRVSVLVMSRQLST